MQISASQISQLLDGTLEGDPDVQVSGPSRIEEGGKGTITFLANPKYEAYAYTTTASVILVSREFTPVDEIAATLIRVDDVYASIARLLETFGGQVSARTGGISEHALVHENAIVEDQVSLGPMSFVAKGARIGKGSVIHEQVYIGENVRIGEGVILYPGVRIYRECEVGDHCIIHSNAVIGSDGFGFAPDETGTYKKIPQIGNVVIEEQVEIGSCVTIDRATMGSTRIRRGVKIDNLVQIAHNVEIGAHTVIAAQAGVAGSTKVGKNCMIGGQVGIAGHLRIADGTKVQAQSGIASNIAEPGSAIFGSPAIPYNDYLRSYAIFKKLPDLYRRIRELEKELDSRRTSVPDPKLGDQA